MPSASSCCDNAPVTALLVRICDASSWVARPARSGFDPYGLPGVLQQLRAQAPDNPLFALSLSTHPPAQQRLDLLEQAMGHRLDALSAKPSVKIAQRLAPPGTARR